MTESPESLSTKVSSIKQAAYWFISVLNVSGDETYARYTGKYMPLHDVINEFCELILEKEGVKLSTKDTDRAFVSFRKDFPGFGKLEQDNRGKSVIAIRRLNGPQKFDPKNEEKYAEVAKIVDQLGY